MLHDAIPLYHSDTSSLYLLPILQSSETAPGSRMALQPHPRSTVQQSRARGSPLELAGHQPLGPDDDPSTNEGRGTPHDTPEGLDHTSCRSDHSNPFHTTLGQSYRVSEPKGGIGVLDKPSSPGSVGEGATPAGMLSAELPASSPPTEASSDPEGFGLTVWQRSGQLQ